MAHRTSKSLVLAAALLVSLALAPSANAMDREAAVPVETAKVTVGAIDAAYHGTATLEAEEEATVLARTTGIIEQILVEEGQRVKAGQPLARLETDRLKLEVARAKAEADKAQD